MTQAKTPIGKVAILGANGAIGRTLGPLLSAQGTPYRVVGRSLLALQIRFNEDPLCEHLQWDPEDTASFAEACAGVETVVYLVGPAVWKYKDTVPLMKKTLAAARAGGVRRLLVMSSNWSYGPFTDEPVTEAGAREPQTEKGRIRKEQEDLVLAAHVPGSFTTAVLRVAELYGPKVEASALWSAFQAAKRGTEAQVLGPIDEPHEFAYVPDVAATVATMLETEAIWNGETGQAWNLGGVAVTTIHRMISLIFATERKPEKFKVPGRWMLKVVRAMNPYIREIEEMSYLQEQTLLLNDTKLRTALGTLTKTSYPEAVRQTLALR
jgi:nucleoside-diphosphate-sugar epimerase